MAQSLADLEAVAVLSPDQAEPIQGQQVGKDPSTSDLATRARAWYIQAVTHPLWADYIVKAKEDEGFYVGGEGQWSKDGSRADLDRLKEEGRVTVSINHCQSIVDILVGFERQNRFDLKASPQGEEDPEQAETMSWLLKWAQDQCEAQEYQSEMFEDGLIGGMSALEVGVDWTTDPVKGEIQVNRLKPGVDVIWDPYWKKYDLSDARYVIKFQWSYVLDLMAAYPEHEDVIEQAAGALGHAFMNMTPEHRTTDGALSGPSDPYGFVGGHPVENVTDLNMFYDPKDRRMLIMEVYYREYDIAYICVNKETQAIEEFDTAEPAQALVDSDPVRWRKVMRRKRKIRMGTVIPAAYISLEDGDSPYENDLTNYPIVPYVAKRKGDEVYGIIRNLKDPQMVENKKMSQLLDILARFAAVRYAYEENSLVNPQALNDPTSTEPLIFRIQKKAPELLVAMLGPVAQVLVEMQQQSKLSMREISGVNTDLLGQKSDNTSGIAIARRQAQGQTISTVFFDNLRRTRKIVGQRLAKRIQQCFTTEQYIRLTHPDSGEPMVLYLNPAGVKRMSGTQYEEFMSETVTKFDGARPQILKDASALKYDIVISEAPSTPTARATALLALLEVVGKMPQILPAVIDVILKLAEIPDRATIIQRIQAMIPGAAGGAPPGGGAPGDGMPPGGPGAGAPPVPGGPPGAAPLAGGPVHVGGPGAPGAGPGSMPSAAGAPTVVQPPNPQQVMPQITRGNLGQTGVAIPSAT